MRIPTSLLIGLLGGLLLPTKAPAQEPLYIVNGTPRSAEEFRNLDPERIEHVEQLPADEETIARYGSEAGNGVVLVTLKFDIEAHFQSPDHSSFEAYVIQSVNWGEEEAAARVVIRYTIEADGSLLVEKVLDATDKRLLRRTLKALEASPLWQPATRNGKAVRQQGLILNLTLPRGRHLPRERYIILR